jgi:hypothetical protein
MSKKSKRTFSRPSEMVNTRTEFNPDYATTKHDLKRTASLWLVLVAVLIVLAIFQTPLLKLFVK